MSDRPYNCTKCMVPLEYDGLCAECAAADPQPCGQCGDPDADYAPDPYAEDIHGDDTPVWLCADCRHQRAMDI